MPTIYTFNSKVLKNIANDKWLIKKPLPTDEVQIGNQIWKTKNLAIDDGQGGIYTQTVNYGQGDVVEYYYTRDAAVRIASSITGWHLPTAAEWDTLAATVGGTSIVGTKLKSTYGWAEGYNGTDDYGFAAFPAGNRKRSTFYYLYRQAWFWTSTNYKARYFDLGNTINTYTGDSRDAMSVRLIKD